MTDNLEAELEAWSDLYPDLLEAVRERNRLRGRVERLEEALRDIARGPLQGPGNFGIYAQARAQAALDAEDAGGGDEPTRPATRRGSAGGVDKSCSYNAPTAEDLNKIEAVLRTITFNTRKHETEMLLKIDRIRRALFELETRLLR